MIQIRLDPFFFDRKFENIMLQRIFLYIVDQALFRMFFTITEHYVNEISRPNDCRVEKVQIEVLPPKIEFAPQKNLLLPPLK